MTKIEMKRRAFAKLTEEEKWAKYAALNKNWRQMEQQLRRVSVYWDAFTLAGLLDNEEAGEAAKIGDEYAVEMYKKAHELQDAG